MKIIYIDEMFLINWIINLVLLNLTSVVTKINISIKRLMVVSTIASIYSILIMFPEFGILFTPLSKILFSMLLILVSYGKRKPLLYIKTLIIFYLLTFSLGGCAYAMINFFGDYKNILWTHFRVPIKILFLSTALSYLLISIIIDYLRKIKLKSQNITKLIIHKDYNQIKLNCLLDTGNNLFEPFTQNRILVVNLQYLSHLFSEEIINQLKSTNLDQIQHEDLLKLKFRIIPFLSLGNTHGLMIVFTPDKVEIYSEIGWQQIKRIAIGISNTCLTQDDSFQAILNPHALDIE